MPPLKVSDISRKRVDELNSGQFESSHLMEIFACDFNKIAKSANIDLPNFTDGKILQKMQFFGRGISDYSQFQNHKSDIVRGWCTFNIAQQKDLSCQEKIIKILPFANDHHFAVREWAWLAIRNDIINNLELSLKMLIDISKDKSYYLRRFAIEITRPRGVWCRHIKKLKENPQLAIDIINNNRKDENLYVKNSVGNWLNDSIKDNKQWVLNLCQKWSQEENQNCKYIIRRALRNFDKKQKIYD